MSPKIVVLLVAVLAGCGSRTISDLPLPASADEDAAPSDGAGMVDTGGTEPSADGDVPVPVDDAGEDPPPPIDAGAPVGIRCGMSECNAATQQCCVTPSSTGATSECRALGACGDRSIALSCSSGASCPGDQVCCLTLSMTGSTAACRASCGGGGGSRSFQLCAEDDECPAGRRCRNTMFGVRACVR